MKSFSNCRSIFGWTRAIFNGNFNSRLLLLINSSSKSLIILNKDSGVTSFKLSNYTNYILFWRHHYTNSGYQNQVRTTFGLIGSKLFEQGIFFGLLRTNYAKSRSDLFFLHHYWREDGAKILFVKIAKKSVVYVF